MSPSALSRDYVLPNWLAVGLRALSLILPLLFLLGLYEKKLAYAGFALTGGVIGLALFFNVNLFLAGAMPLIYLFAENRILLGAVLIFFLSFSAARLRAGHLSIVVPFWGAMVAFIAALSIGVSLSAKPDIGLYFAVFSYLFPILILIAVFNLNLQTKLISLNLLILSFVAAILGWASFAVYLQTGMPRVVLGWASQNLAAGFFGLMLPIALLRLITAKSSLGMSVWGFSFLGILSGIFVTQTRAVMFAAVFAVFYLALKDRRVLKIVTPAVLVGLIAAPSLILFRILMLFGHGTTPDWSSVGRIEVWTNSVTWLKDVLWFGIGIDSFRTQYPAEFPASFLRAEHAHNTILRWLFDIGLFGTLALLSIIAKVVWRAIKAVRKVKLAAANDDERTLIGINAAIICVSVGAMFDTPLNSPQVGLLFWTFIAYQISLVQRIAARRESLR